MLNYCYVKKMRMTRILYVMRFYAFHLFYILVFDIIYTYSRIVLLNIQAINQFHQPQIDF